MVIGEHGSGRVHLCEGEYADTQFLSFNRAPLYPSRSFWITGELGEGKRLGFPIKLHRRSVLVAYLQTWVLALAAFGLMISTSLVLTSLSAALVALGLWSWTWSAQRGLAARRRSDFDRLALGSRCDPAWMTDEMRDGLARTLSARLAQLPSPRPPEDVARFGAVDLEEGLLAYGLLRLAAVKNPASAAAAEQVLERMRDRLPPEGSPYRELLASGVPELGAAISAAVEAQAEATRARIRAARAEARPSWLQRPWLQVAGLLLFTPAMGLVIVIRWPGLARWHDLASAEERFSVVIAVGMIVAFWAQWLSALARRRRARHGHAH